MLRFLRNETALAWLCAGDFNEILYDHEQFGGNDRGEWLMEGFCDVMSYGGFTDLGYNGLPYTWDNRREGRHNVKVCLDRAIVDDALLDMFGDSVVTHIQTTESDHCALLIRLQRTGWLQGQRRERPFRYENMWRRHENYETTVSTAWTTGCSSLEAIHSNLRGLQHTLSSWEWEQFGSVRKELGRLRSELERIRSCSLYSGPTKEEREVMNRLSELLAREEVMAKQRSRVEWLNAGDRNMGFFHAKARQRARTNKITALRRQDGSMVMDQSGLKDLAVEFYHHLFLAQEFSNPEVVVRYVPAKVTNHHNELLCSPFTEAEI
jgi:hypothetical protein